MWWELYNILSLLSLILTKFKQIGQICVNINIQQCYTGTILHNVYNATLHILLLTIML